MTYSVSSGFISTARQSTASFKRIVTIAGSDYSSRVVSWPQFQNVSDRINIDNVSMNFANTDQVFSHFPADLTLMEQRMLVKLGFDYTVSSTQYITLFDGKVDSFRMIGGSIQINAANKFAQLSNRTIGSLTTPTNYTASDYAPSDLAWYIATSHGGLSALTTSANPDIDYPAYTSWTAANSAAPMLLRARFQGERAIDSMERLAKATRSSVLIENGKLKFVQIPSTPGTIVDDFTYDNTIGSDVLFDKRSMFNRYYVGADLDVTSQFFKTTVVAANSASVNSYGARDSNLWDKSVWHASSTSAQRLADFVVTKYGVPLAQVTAKTPLSTAFVGIGDSITFMDSNSNIYGSFSVKRETIDMESATKTYQLENVSGNNTPITLDLPFSVSKTMPASITFTRSSTATYYDDAGVLTSAAINEPRFDHDPATGESLGLLVEEARTNLLTYSEQFDNAVWTKQNSTITANAVAAPDGTTTADKVTVTNAVTGNIIRSTVLTAVSHTISIYAKAAEWSWLMLGATTAGNSGVWFNLSTGVVGTQNAGYTGTIQNIGNGWYRCSVTFTATAASWFSIVFPTNVDNAFSAGDGASGIYIWGAQLEAGAFPTSYIPTTTASVTRSADVASMTGTNFSSWYNSTEGCLVSVFKANTSGTRTIFDISDGTANERIYLQSIAGALTLKVVDAGVEQCSLSLGSLTNGTIYKVSSAWKLNDFAASINGTTVVTDTAGTLPTVTKINIGSDYNNTNASNATLIRETSFPRRLVNSNLQALSV